VAAGKRLKCPKCATRFVVSEEDASSISTIPGSADAATTSFDLDKRPGSEKDLPIATSEGDLRDTFDLPLVSGREVEQGQVASDPLAADAAALFKDEGPSKRRPTAAEARSRARRCSHCGGFVPQGMSICVTCGTDQDTGLRVGFDDDLMPPPPPRVKGPPLHVSIIGGLCGTAGIIFMLLGVIQSTRGESNIQNYGWLALALISAFGIFACVQFVRGKSVKLLMLALALGVGVDVISLIAVPLTRPILQPKEDMVKEVRPTEITDSSVAITPFEERMDTRKITLGVGLIILYAGLSLYLMSPPVKRYFFHSRIEQGSLPL